MATPPTRLISWLALCLEADPYFWEETNFPDQYEFSNGRTFVRSQPVYQGPVVDVRKFESPPIFFFGA